MRVINFRYRPIFHLIMGLGILILSASLLFTDLAIEPVDVKTGSDAELDTGTTRYVETTSFNKFNRNTDNSNIIHDETIEETIARIKRDVYLTATITGNPGKETASFQIEGMPDLSFHINTQLMDGFIITEITNSHVVLKNQGGDETFSLIIGDNRNEVAEVSMHEKAEGTEVALKPESNTAPKMLSEMNLPLVNPDPYRADEINQQIDPSGMADFRIAEPRTLINPDQYIADTINQQIDPSGMAGIIVAEPRPLVNPDQYVADTINQQNDPSGMADFIAAEPRPLVNPDQYGVATINQQ